MKWLKECCQSLSSGSKKVWSWISDWRKTDALLRGLARGISMQTCINAIGKLARKDFHLAATISVIPTALVTVYTSHAFTRPTRRSVDDIEIGRSTNSETSSLLTREHISSTSKTTLLLDAVARGVSRADAVIAVTNLLGMAIKYDLEIPAMVLGTAALILGSWSSYRMSTRTISAPISTLAFQSILFTDPNRTTTLMSSQQVHSISTSQTATPATTGI